MSQSLCYMPCLFIEITISGSEFHIKRKLQLRSLSFISGNFHLITFLYHPPNHTPIPVISLITIPSSSHLLPNPSCPHLSWTKVYLQILLFSPSMHLPRQPLSGVLGTWTSTRKSAKSPLYLHVSFPWHRKNLAIVFLLWCMLHSALMNNSYCLICIGKLVFSSNVMDITRRQEVLMKESIRRGTA